MASSSTTEPNSEPFSAKPEALPPHIFHTPIPLKLDSENFLVWRQQVNATLRSLDLLYFLDGSFIPPRLISIEEDTSPIVNFKYIQYDRQDQAILAWLLASMTVGVLTQMVGMDTSAQVWEKLQTHYASQTHAQIKKHKQQLRTPKKDRSISAYLLDIKKTVDQLAVVGCPISTSITLKLFLMGCLTNMTPL